MIVLVGTLHKILRVLLISYTSNVLKDYEEATAEEKDLIGLK